MRQRIRTSDRLHDPRASATIGRPTPSRGELRDTRSGLPTFRAMRVEGNHLLRWPRDLQPSQTPGRFQPVVFDLIGATHTSKQANAKAGFDVVCCTLQALGHVLNTVVAEANAAVTQEFQRLVGTQDVPDASGICTFLVANDQFCVLNLENDGTSSRVADLLQNVPEYFSHAFEEVAKTAGIDNVARRVEEADVHIAVRWGAASLSFRDLLTDASATRAASGAPAFDHADKITMNRAGLRMRALILRAEEECMLGQGLVSGEWQHASRTESSDVLFPTHDLRVGGGALPLIGSFAKAQERSGSLQALNDRPRTQDGGWVL